MSMRRRRNEGLRGSDRLRSYSVSVPTVAVPLALKGGLIICWTAQSYRK